MHRALLFLLLLGLGSSTPTAVPTTPGDGDRAAARALLAELVEHVPPQPLPGVSCQDLLPEALPGFAQLPPPPRALARAAMTLALSGAACTAQAEAAVLGLSRELGPLRATALLRGLARLQSSPAPQPFTLLLLSLARPGGAGRVWPCMAPTQLLGRVAGTPGGALATWPSAEGSRGVPGARAPRAWFPACRRARRHRREDEDACNPPGEREAHQVLEWVPGISVFYNLGTSIYYAFQGCKALASTRALEAAEDLGYTGLAAITASVGGPVAVGLQLGLQPGLKAGVRALIRYFTSEGVPPPAPTAHSGPVLMF
ncbi:APOF protein, partial [Brachypteracias leptosomus]|nr:APOF protein [Brachypteracias leptosomus]